MKLGANKMIVMILSMLKLKPKNKAAMMLMMLWEKVARL
jgi:hypothetical protein